MTSLCKHEKSQEHISIDVAVERHKQKMDKQYKTNVASHKFKFRRRSQFPSSLSWTRTENPSLILEVK